MNGLIIGKFYPPHKGHEYLIRFAAHFCDQLYIVVCSLESETIPGELRYTWMKKSFPEARVLHLTDELPQDPSEDSHFWPKWKHALQTILPLAPDFLFTSEDYGKPLAEVLEAKWIKADENRMSIPISGTEIRTNPGEAWDYILDEAKPYFRKKIVIFGPESVGKTTLTSKLACHYKEQWVPEYARHFLESKKGEIEYEDLLIISKGQAASIYAILKKAGRLLFCDTDSRATPIWSAFLFGKTDEKVRSIADKQRADLYLLCQPDVPYKDDPVRYLEDEGWAFFEACKEELKDENFSVISGNWEERFQQALSAIEKVLSS